MARLIDIHPQNPQPRAVEQAMQVVLDGGLLAYPTDSGYALGAQLGNKDALERIRAIRRLDDKHHFTVVCKDFAQLGQFVHVDNAIFRAVKNATPGPYTFILPATREVPRRLLHAKKKTVGARIPDHVVVQALLASLGEPLLSSTLILPEQEEAMTEGWLVKEELNHQVDAVVESGDVTADPTTVIDFADGTAEVVREGAGDSSRFL
ncbi:L-threonylcarbamoyladenylate synthase [Aeromicrobium sp. CTD01-1L150]|uniref:L-threonylcarbamoyladenylate synthase n=1 Tax=Aeromicrobium sp. CTD01-1L150 TaxID=3341830 RepID=UPI0035C21AFA